MGDLKILVVGDVHFPFSNKVALNKVYELSRQLKPSIIVQIGDLLDMFSFSRFPRSFNVITPKEEILKGRNEAEQMWRWLQRSSPKAKCFQLIGNHESRLPKRLFSSFPEAEGLIDFDDIFGFPEVETLKSERDELIIKDILFMHGFRTKLGDHARHNSMKTVCGHSHTGGCVYLKLGDKTIWELNAGYLANKESEPLSYTRQRKVSTWTTGVGFIDELGPRFIPLGG